jgi:hypothetical protein
MYFNKTTTVFNNEKNAGWSLPPLCHAKPVDIDFSYVPSLLLLGPEANLSSQLVPRLKMRGDISPLPQYALMAWRLINREICIHGVVIS